MFIMLTKTNNQKGFIPMLILLVVVVLAVVWFAYKHVSDAHRKTLINAVQQNENSLNR